MRFPYIGALLVAAVLAGCGDGKPKASLPPLHPAKGKVVRGAAGVSGGSIQFAPVTATDANRDLFISAEVKSNGTFELSTVHSLSQKSGTGAPEGDYQATYTPAMGDQTQVSAQDLTPVTLPSTIQIKPGPNELTIDLDAK